MLDEELLALNVYEEAGGEIPDGQAAVARVTLNRIKRKFFSDGTMLGTVLAKDQFSWAWFGFVTRVTGTGAAEHVEHKYIRLAHTLTEAQQLADDLMRRALPRNFSACRRVADQVSVGSYGGTLYDKLTDDAVLYLNPRILTALPSWAIAEKLVCSIGHHDFYRA